MTLLRIEPAVINSIADMLTDDPEIFNDESPGKFLDQEQALPSPVPPPKKKRRPLGAPPPYSGSPKNREAGQAKQKAVEKTGMNRSPFGDGLMHDLDGMIIG